MPMCGAMPAERDQPRGGRRNYLIFRLAFYVLAGALVAALLVARHHADEDASSLHEVRSETSEDGALVLKFDDHGVLRSWDVTLAGTCYGGGLDGVRWHPADSGAPARVVRRDDVLDAVEVRRHRDPVAGPSTIRVALHARVTNDLAAGSFRYVKRRTRGPRNTRRCSSLPIRFFVPLD
jgi:hypothetical protein